MNPQYKHIHFVSFQSLVNWSVAHLLNKEIGFTKQYPFVSIGDLIHRSSELVTIVDDILYTQVTLKTNGGGAVLRDKKLGKDIGTKKQYLAKEGQFIMSKIDARNGAFGVVGKELDGAIVTGDFPLFDVDIVKINPFYLYLLSSTKPFVQFAQSCSRGTTNRQRIDIDAFLDLQIPLPSSEEQNEIVAAYNNSLTLAQQYEQQMQSINEQMEIYWWEILGITAKQTQQELNNKYEYLKFIHFGKLTEWGVDVILKKQKRETFKYPMIKINALCQIGSGGTPSRSYPQYYKGTIPWVKTGEVLNDEIIDTEEHITESAIANSSARLYPKNSLIIAMYGQGDTRGRTAKLGIDATTNQACAVLYDIDNRIVNTDYLWYYLQSRYHDLRSMASGNNQPNLNAGKIKDFDVVIPPLDIQNGVVKHISELKEKIKSLRALAADTRTSAIQQFEQTIYS